MSFSPIKFPPAFAGRSYDLEPTFGADDFFARLSHVLREQGLNPATMVTGLIMPDGPARAMIDMLIIRHTGQPALHCIEADGSVDIEALDWMATMGKPRLLLNFSGLETSANGQISRLAGPLEALLQHYLQAYERAAAGVVLVDRQDELLLRIDNALLDEPRDISLDLGFMLLRDRHDAPHELERGPTWRGFRSSREFAQSIREQGFGSAKGEAIGKRLNGQLVRFDRQPVNPLDALLQAYWPGIISSSEPMMLAAQRLTQLQFAQLADHLEHSGSHPKVTSLVCSSIHQQPEAGIAGPGAGSIFPWAMALSASSGGNALMDDQQRWIERLNRQPNDNPEALNLMQLIGAKV